MFNSIKQQPELYFQKLSEHFDETTLHFIEQFHQYGELKTYGFLGHPV